MTNLLIRKKYLDILTKEPISFHKYLDHLGLENRYDDIGNNIQ